MTSNALEKLEDESIVIPVGTPLTVRLNDGTLSFSIEIQKLLEGTSHDIAQVVAGLMGRDPSFLDDYSAIDYSPMEVYATQDKEVTI